MIKKIGLGLGIALVVTAVGFGLGRKHANQTAQSATSEATASADNAKPSLTVKVVHTMHLDLPQTMFANGNVSAWQEAIIGTEVSGLRLSKVLVNVGDTVKKGQLLAEFARDTIEADLAQKQASVAQAEANWQKANSDADRARSLPKGAISDTQLTDYLNKELTAKAELTSAKAQLQSQQIKLSQTRVIAPESGTITSRTATLGNVAGSGQELFRMIVNNRLEWRADLTASQWPSIQVGMPVHLNVNGGSAIEGKVRMIAPTINQDTRNTLVYVDLPSDALRTVKPGMFLSGEFVIGKQPAVILEDKAVIQRDGSDYVFAVKSDSAQKTRTVQQIKVQTGRRLQNTVEIISGVAPDMDIVSEGAGFLNDGNTVQVVQ